MSLLADPVVIAEFSAGDTSIPANFARLELDSEGLLHIKTASGTISVRQSDFQQAMHKAYLAQSAPA